MFATPWRLVPASGRFRRRGAALLSIALLCGGCADLELCPPRTWTAGFLSQGDCLLTRADAFGGHEWLTDLANRELRDADGRPSFVESEIKTVIEGNRRVDFPKSLLIHLSNSVVAYADALSKYHDLPEHQARHFLLDDRNSSPEAAAESHAHMQDLSQEAVELWEQDRVRALTLIGQACHTLQDSYSPAHARRDMDDSGRCVVKLKAYLKRAPGFLSDDIEFHGGTEEDTVGHITPLDSIYREGRDCRNPDGRAAVKGCLSTHAELAIEATSAYLEAMLDLLRSDAPPEMVEERIEAYLDRYMSLCE